MTGALAEIVNPRLVGALIAGDPVEVRSALPGATLLVPASGHGGSEAIVQTRRAAGGRRLVCAFTDLEALQAWDREPSSAAVALGSADVGDLVPAEVVALNPAGPGAYLVDGEALNQTRAPKQTGALPQSGAAENGHGSPTGPPFAPELADPARRRVLRRRANQAHELARRSAAAGDLSDACEQLQPALAACAELGDRLHGAAAALELARWRADSGLVELALAGWRGAAETMASLGELDLALEALLDAAETAADEGLISDAGALAVTALDIAAGADFSDRLTSLWRRLDGR